MLRIILICALMIFQSACFDSDRDSQTPEAKAETTASTKSDQGHGQIKAGDNKLIIEPGRDYEGQKKRRCAGFATKAVGAAMTLQNMEAIAANNAEAAVLYEDFKVQLEQEFPLATLPRLIYDMATDRVSTASGGTEIIDQITNELTDHCMSYPFEIVLSYGPL